MYLLSEISFLPTILLILLWLAGGWMIAFRLFDIPVRERGLVGLGLGLVMSTWIANFSARVLPLPLAFWFSAFLTFAFGAYLVFPIRHQVRAELFNDWGQWTAFVSLAILFTLINRGLAIFEDYQNLPVMSVMATGKIPPPFPFAHGITFNYHYILLLLATQFVNIGHAAVWTALDVARGLTMPLLFLYTGLFAYRLTNRSITQFVGVLFAMFAGGTLWLLLLFPTSLIQKISDNVTLIGSAAQSGSSLFDLLYKPWLIDGGPPIPFPFVFVSGVNNPTIMSIGGPGVMPALILLLVLLLGTRLRQRLAVIPLTITLASLALANEVTFSLLIVGFALVILIWAIQNRSIKLPASLQLWFGVFFSAGILSLIQGGIITGVVAGLSGDKSGGYFEGGLHFVFPPAIVSGHLSVLSLFNPYQLIAALLEIGPIILVLPLAFMYGRGALKGNNWLEAGFIFSGLVSLFMTFTQYNGNAGLTATSRLYGNFILVSWIYAVPLVWGWTRQKGDWAIHIAMTLGVVACMSGIVLFASQMSAFYRPVPSYLLSDLDVQMYNKYWNKLPTNAMVFDARTPRGVIVFGRGSDSAQTLYLERPDFLAFADSPDPARIHAAGYDYMYYTNFYWDEHKTLLDAPCTKVIEQIDDIHSATGELGNFRRLVDIRFCK